MLNAMDEESKENLRKDKYLLEQRTGGKLYRGSGN
jgi:hypothetical protein